MIRASAARHRIRSLAVNWHSKYGVLQMIAVATHGLEDLAKALIVRDVVTDQI